MIEILLINYLNFYTMKAKISSVYSFLFLLFCSSAYGQGILFSEYRLIIKAGEIRTLQVCNPTDQTRSYKLYAVDKKMNDGGGLEDIPLPVNYPSSLKKQLRIFPKRITLAPNECQEVQLQLKNTSQLPDGEFRSFLFFLPLVSAKENNFDAPVAAKGTTPNIVMRIGAAIPIFYRKNSHVDKAFINKVSLKQDSIGKHTLSLRLNREGSQSTYGVVQVKSKSKGESIMIAERHGNAIYPEANWKELSIPLRTDTLDVDASGKIPISISYTNTERGSKQETFTEWNGAL